MTEPKINQFADHPTKGRCLPLKRYENGVYRVAHDGGELTSNALAEDLTPLPDCPVGEEGWTWEVPLPRRRQWYIFSEAGPGIMATEVEPEDSYLGIAREVMPGDPDPDAMIAAREGIVSLAKRYDGRDSHEDELWGLARQLGWEGE